MPKSSEQNRAALLRRFVLASAMLSILAASQTILAREGGTSHILPGANATLVDVLPTAPGLAVELKWLPELGTKNRLNCSYLWLKIVYKF